MADAHHLSSPSTSASSKSPSSKGSTSTGDQIVLSLQQQPPQHLFSNEPFDLIVQLENPLSNSSSRVSYVGKELEVVASLVYEGSEVQCGAEALLITQPSKVILNSVANGILRGKFVCLIRMDNIQQTQGASLAVKVSSHPDSILPIRGPLEVTTTAIKIVNYKTKVIPEDDWGPVWYKDEGGRDKSMEVYATLIDKEGQVKTGEQIPLSTVLCYKATPGQVPKPVTNQEILRLLGAPTKTVIDKDTGRARIRFRVEDVSKNHQAQDFVLRVGPDPKLKSFADIAPEYTPAVNVRSKRNKRSRNPLHRRTASDHSKRSSPSVSRLDQSEIPPAVDQSEAAQVREALRSVVHWTDEVVNGLYPLQWQIVGYPRHHDGSTDYQRPYHNMPNPNPCISRILGMYSESVRDNIGILLNILDRADSRSDDASSFLPIQLPIAVPSQLNDNQMYNPPRHVHQQGQMMAHGGIVPTTSQMMLRGRPIMNHAALPDYQTGPAYDQPFLHGPSTMQVPMMQPFHQHHQMPSGQPYMPRPSDADIMPIQLTSRIGDMPSMNIPDDSVRGPSEEESRESEVEYVLAKQYKALRTGERLGFPAYSINKEILGFYRDEAGFQGKRFSPISRHRNDFGPLEIMQATEILDDAVKKKSDAVHTLKEWGTIENLLDRAMVYDWRQDIGDGSQGPVRNS